MKIDSTLTNRSGQTLRVTYCDIEEEKELDGKKVGCVHAYCFCDDKLVIVYGEDKGYWTPPGGGVEQGESITEAVAREVLEETNMRVIKQELLGYQDIFEPNEINTQTRHVCLVEPVGEFDSDPDGDITEIKLIDPKDLKQYFDWGVVGDRLLERALEKLPKLKL
jgi:ADP-ribose pyrophosphatase YjhB (NUDIX family)